MFGWLTKNRYFSTISTKYKLKTSLWLQANFMVGTNCEDKHIIRLLKYLPGYQNKTSHCKKLPPLQTNRLCLMNRRPEIVVISLSHIATNAFQTKSLWNGKKRKVNDLFRLRIWFSVVRSLSTYGFVQRHLWSCPAWYTTAMAWSAIWRTSRLSRHEIIIVMWW